MLRGMISPVLTLHFFNRNGIRTFLALFCFESNFIVFFNGINKSVDVNEDAFLCDLIFDEPVTFGFIKESYSASSRSFGLGRLMFGHTDLDVFRIKLLLL